MRRTHVVLMLLALLLASTNAWAQGFGVWEQSACTVGRGGAGVAAPCNDGSSVFYNPAGLSIATRPGVSFGGSFINPVGQFTNDNGNVGSMQSRFYTVPNLYAVVPLKKLAVGVGFFAPYGLTTDWPLNFEGRFLGYKTSLQGIYLQPTLAYKVNDKVSIGVGVDLGHTSLELNQRVDLSSQALGSSGLTFKNIGVPAGTDFANVKISGSSWDVGFNLGFQAKVAPKMSVGARYLSRMAFNITDGDFSAYQIATNLTTPVPLPGIPAGTPIDYVVRGNFVGQGPLAVQGASTGITFPDQFVLGTAVQAGTHTTVFGDYVWTHWALFDQLTITRQYVTTPTVMVENYNNTNGVRLGIEHQLKQPITLRGGFVMHSAAAPDETVTPLLPEGPRKEFSFGAGFRVAKDLHADFYYLYLMQNDRRGRTIAGDASNNNGTYAFTSNLFGITFGYGF